MGMIRYAKLGSSARLQRLLRALSDGKWHSTEELNKGAHVQAVSAAACELRRNGIPVVCRHRPETKFVWEYRIGGAHD